MLKLKLMIVDWHGEKWTLRTFNLPDGLSRTAIDIWKEVTEKIAKEKYPEAQNIYFEN